VTATRRFALLLALIGLLAGACSDDGSEGPSPATPPNSPSAEPSGVTSVPPGSGVYVYENAGLTATVDLDDTTGTIEIVNDTGRELAKPDLYVLDARDGHEILGRVLEARPIPNGERASFEVAFPPELDVKNIGLLILLIGTDNYGAFVPQ
jgi:hypothetical protein